MKTTNTKWIHFRTIISYDLRCWTVLCFCWLRMNQKEDAWDGLFINVGLLCFMVSFEIDGVPAEGLPLP